MAASGVTLWYRNVSIAYFVLPIQHVPEDKERGDVIEIEATTVASVDSDGFARLVTHFMQESVVNVSVSATIAANVTTVVGPLSLHDIPLSQALVLNGVGGFRDIQVVGFDVFGGGAKSALQVWVKARLYNPSSLSATLGAVTFDLLYDGWRLGEVRRIAVKRLLYLSYSTLTLAHDCLTLLD